MAVQSSVPYELDGFLHVTLTVDLDTLPSYDLYPACYTIRLLSFDVNPYELIVIFGHIVVLFLCVLSTYYESIPDTIDHLRNNGSFGISGGLPILHTRRPHARWLRRRPLRGLRPVRFLRPQRHFDLRYNDFY